MSNDPLVDLGGSIVCAACAAEVGSHHHDYCPWIGEVGSDTSQKKCGHVTWQSDPLAYTRNWNGDGVEWEQAPITVPFEQKLQMAGEEISKLVVEKNRAYGNSVNKTVDQLKTLFPSGVDVSKYRDLLLMIRVLDKFNRLSDGDKTAFGENPWRDIAGYGIIGMAQGMDDE